MSLSHICLSDLHLGAAYSLLTHVDADGTPLPTSPSPTLEAFATALRATVRRMQPPAPPVLVLMGDVLDMGLSSAGDTSQAFLRFVDQMFPAGEDPLFSTELICLPGNHDHNLWHLVQTDQFLDQIGTVSEDHMPDNVLKVTPMLAEPHIEIRILTRLMRTRPHLADARVHVAYPNYALKSADGTRAVVMHHGHYLDSMYRALSRLKSWLTGSAAPPSSVEELESENGPWVGFLWSDLGNAGAVGKGAGTLYEVLLDAGASHGFAETIASRLLGDLGASYGVRGDTRLTHGVTIDSVVRGLVDLSAGRAAESQRDGYREVLSADEIHDIGWYVGTLIARQWREEAGDTLPRKLSFLFGHTHKPFQDQLAIAPFATPVALYNSGGWVMDQPTMMACQGGAALLIDAELNVASLRLFNDPVGEAVAPVHVAGVGGALDAANPLLASAREAVAAEPDLWGAFTDVAGRGIAKRAAMMLQQMMANG